MKIKEINSKNVKLIPRKEIGGLIPKFEKPAGEILSIYQWDALTRNGRKLNTAWKSEGKMHRVLKEKNKFGLSVYVLYSWDGKAGDDSDPINISSNQTLINTGTGHYLKKRDTQNNNTKNWRLVSEERTPVKSKWIVAQNDWIYNGRKINKGDEYLISAKDNSVTIKSPLSNDRQASKTDDNKPKNTTTPSSAIVTLTTIPTPAIVTTPTTTGNYTIQRGDTLSKIAAANNTTVQELMRLNPKITNANRIYTGRTLRLPGIQDVLQNVLTETTKPTSYGFGVTDSNLKLGTNNLYYPESNSDDLLRKAFASNGLNFDDYKNLTASNLPTGTAPINTLVKSFAPNPELESNNIKEKARVAAYRKKIIDNMPEKLIGLPTVARNGVKLIKRNK